MRYTTKTKIAILLVLVLCVCMVPSTSLATTTKDKLEQAQKEKEELEQKLNENNENMDNLKEEKSSLQEELSGLNSDLTAVSNKLSDLEAQIVEKEAEIEATTIALENATLDADEQYEAMKERIKFMYERSDYTFMEMLFSASSFSDLLNSADYIEQLSAYDRDKLNEYKAIRDSIKELQELKITEKAELDELKAQTEEQKNQVAGLVSQTRNVISKYSDEIDAAERAALEYEATIKAKDDDIEYLKKQLAEEMRLSQMSANATKRDISEVTFAEGDRYLLANLIYCEAGGEPYEGQLAVGAVVINRVLSSVYPETVVGVIYQNRQFSPAASGRLALALAQGKATASCYKAADEAMQGMTNVGGCVYFRTPVEGLSGISIGGHIFY